MEYPRLELYRVSEDYGDLFELKIVRGFSRLVPAQLFEYYEDEIPVLIEPPIFSQEEVLCIIKEPRAI